MYFGANTTDTGVFTAFETFRQSPYLYQHHAQGEVACMADHFADAGYAIDYAMGSCFCDVNNYHKQPEIEQDVALFTAEHRKVVLQ